MKSENTTPETRRKVIKRFIQIFVQFTIIFAILFFSSGHAYWTWLWAYMACTFLILSVNLVVLPLDLIAERSEAKADTKAWDKKISVLSGVFVILSYFAAGFDERFQISGPVFPIVLHYLGAFLFLAGSFLFTWAMVSNRYFSTLVRLQFDRGHVVETGGPYRFVRHPGYTGYIIFSTGGQLLLGSWVAQIPVLVCCLLFILRTYLEDNTLKKELPGYEDYAARVRYRLLPGIW